MEKMAPIHKIIWDLALEYQDKRNDSGHAHIALEYAQELLEKIGFANQDIVIPAIILHDIGWSQMPEEKLLIAYNPPSKEAEYTARLEHQIYAIELANKILKMVKYNPSLISDILIIISQHDTRKGWHSFEDVIVRDADKLWRYSETHLKVGVKNKGWTKREEINEHLKKTEENIGQDGFFMIAAAKEIARRDFEKIYKPTAELIMEEMNG